jgi:hypothetical protein
MKTKKVKPWCYIPVNPKSRAKIDKEDLKKVSEYTWRILRQATGRIRVMTSFRTKKGTAQLSLGQLIMKPPKNKMVYTRRFMEELDYRKSNLIICTMSERQKMLPKSRNFGTSKYKGVSFVKKGKKWRAQIEVDDQCINLGIYKNEVLAAQVYNEAAKKYFGNMAYQNQVKPLPASRRKNY